jgi:hypothetical protein
MSVAKNIVSKVVKLKESGARTGAVAKECGIEPGQVEQIMWAHTASQNPIDTDNLSDTALAAEIVRYRDDQGFRWEIIAMASGLSVGKVKALYEATTGRAPNQSYTGRGRRPAGVTAPPKTDKPARKVKSAKAAPAASKTAKRTVRKRAAKASDTNPS